MDHINHYQLRDILSEKNPDDLVIDVRTEEEYEEGHIPNVPNIPLDQLEERIAECKGYKRIYCQCRSGARSQTACQILEENGFTETYNVDGGILAWGQAGLPTT